MADADSKASTERRPSRIENLGDRVRRLRRDRDWTQDQLAEEAKVSKSFISEVESGTSQPRGPLLVKLATALGASIDYLLTGREPQGPRPNAPLQVPRELAAVAERLHLPFPHVALLLEFQSAIEARRSDQSPRELTEAEWQQFYESVRPQLQKELGAKPE